MRVLIIGSGIGGLTTAIALQRIGLDVRVCERAPILAEVGAGLTLWSNAVRVLRELGLGPAIEAVAAPLRHSELRTADGTALGTMDIAAISARAGAPTLGIHRAELQRVLASQTGDRLRLGMACVAVSRNERSVTARFANGQEEQADILIGADGLRSTVRTELFGSQRPRYAGYTAWRGVARIDSATIPIESTQLIMGRGAHFGCLPIGGRWVYWFIAARAYEGEQNPGSISQAILMNRFGHWCDPVPAMIMATRPDQILRTDIFDRPPMRTWGIGRVTLLGDAAHPTTPTLGQGACMAIEDAWVLARILGKASDPVAALRSFEQQRQDRTALVTRQSWQLGRILALESRFWCWMRNRIMARMTGLMAQHTERLIAADLE